jgi:prepilin-type N-terminal cleavage/methylation domain-containing protein/prepilin-type processing-associated H-X9-DG protein
VDIFGQKGIRLKSAETEILKGCFSPKPCLMSTSWFKNDRKTRQAVCVKQEKKMKRKAFTLVELLVVIAIIALLLSILMPALKNVREQAKSIVCATRQAQWGQYLNLYAVENKDRIPYLQYNSVPLPACVMWFDKLGKYMSNKDNDGSAAGYSQNFFLKLLECPASTQTNGVYIGPNSCAWEVGYAPFTYEIAVIGLERGKVNPPTKLSRIRQPSSLFGFLDTESGFIQSPMLGNGFFRFTIDYDGDGMKDSFQTAPDFGKAGLYNGARPRTHSDGGNLWMFDGHREYIKFKTFWKSDNDGWPTHPFWKFRPN